ncbi:MAG: metal ABC transporter permease [Gammaproteobacteria bacterium]|nr:metal ABC transporter permease [Gammaproteobacteria bacterium]NIR98617.1 metal ABC transporter permease [Gammaproteobacteria bacterium]NIT64340.1 metal ABC transporter permease [Gammaproteobacteria bacterium]NIV21264.1 metal ABC transporter permease [Gammaproteobacteria bacterium]NIX10968.1 metal ABC transporter permease [Gammaproteobacteria bacterium]
MSLAALDADLLLVPALTGLLVAATHVPLGREVLARGIIFVDLAVAQVAALGVTAAYALGAEPQGWAVQAAAGGSALTGALLLQGMERRWPAVQEALIGTTFVLAATAALLILAGHPHGAEHIQELLAGQLLWTRPQQLPPVALLSVLVLALWFGARRWRRGLFYTLFALSVTASVQLVGLYLVFATLIIPALAVRRLKGIAGLGAGYGLAAAGYLVGIGASALLDLPAGPAVVWALALLAVGMAGVRGLGMQRRGA